MTDEPQPRRLVIPHDVAASEGVPDDLNAEVVGPYAIPDVARRRRAGAVYLVAAAVTAVAVLAGLPTGMWGAVVGFILIGIYHFLSGWKLQVREVDALEVAGRSSEFPIGHASAALSFSGWRSRPIWNVLVFSADEPPSNRGLVRVDAVHGSVVETYFEPIELEESDKQ